MNKLIAPLAVMALAGCTINIPNARVSAPTTISANTSINANTNLNKDNANPTSVDNGGSSKGRPTPDLSPTPLVHGNDGTPVPTSTTTPGTPTPTQAPVSGFSKTFNNGAELDAFLRRNGLTKSDLGLVANTADDSGKIQVSGRCSPVSNFNSCIEQDAWLIANGKMIVYGQIVNDPEKQPTSSNATNNAKVTTLAGLNIASAVGLNAPTGHNTIFIPNDGNPTQVTVEDVASATVTTLSISGAKAFAFKGSTTYVLTSTKIVKMDGSGITMSGVSNPSDFIIVDNDAFVISEANHCIYKVNMATGAGAVFVGQQGLSGYVDGAGASARLNTPKGVTYDATSNALYVADSGNLRLRKVKLDGTVSTLAGSGSPQQIDGQGTGAAFKAPYDITSDGAGTLYVADYGANSIRRISAAGEVTTIAGSGATATVDGTGEKASFKLPSSIAFGRMAGKDVLWIGEDTSVRIVQDW